MKILVAIAVIGASMAMTGIVLGGQQTALCGIGGVLFGFGVTQIILIKRNRD